MKPSLPIEPGLPAANPAPIPANLPQDERNLWSESSFDLARGLEVTELPDIPVVGEDVKP